jgi:hypothetical protein
LSNVEHVGRDDVWGRELFLLSVADPRDLPQELSLPRGRFVCLVAWDARGVEEEQIATVARRLLDVGAVYVCAWGPDCERVHDIVDRERDRAQTGAGEAPVTITTWHDSESLADVLSFVLTSTVPDDGRAREPASTLGIAIGSAQWASEIRAAFETGR